jgi:hypothetical protein
VALIRQFARIHKESNRVHDDVECGWTTFVADGATYLQLDTYGSSGRKIQGKVSQSIQLDPTAAAELSRILRRTFPATLA